MIDVLGSTPLFIKMNKQLEEQIEVFKKSKNAQWVALGYALEAIGNELGSFDKRIKSFEEARKWVITAVGSALLVALLGLLLKA